MKRRIVMLLTVVALMMVMLAMAVAPAFAAAPIVFCTNPETNETIGPLGIQGGTVGSCLRGGYTQVDIFLS